MAPADPPRPELSPPKSPPRSRTLALLLCAAPLLYLYIVFGGIFARSQVPVILGRYSPFLAAFNAWNLFLCVLFITGYARFWRICLEGFYIAVVASTFVAPFNGELNQMAGLTLALPLIRLFACIGLLLVEFERYRRSRRPPSGLILGLAAIVATFTVIDFGLAGYEAVSARETRTSKANPKYRDDYVLADITPQDIVLVGDSFVWGQGVKKEERFGDRLEQSCAHSGRQTKVYSLGTVGDGPAQYIRDMQELPGQVRAGRVVLAFYMNDMPPIPSGQDLVMGLCTVLRRSSMTLGLIGDKLAKLFVPDIDAYHDFVVRCYDHKHPTFQTRWGQLQSQLTEFQQLAARHCERQPLFVILPLVVDYHGYPLEQAHHELAELAIQCGYEPLDLLPAFRDKLGDGTPYRVGPNENHFDARGHRLVAEALWEKLGQPGASRPAG